MVADTAELVARLDQSAVEHELDADRAYRQSSVVAFQVREIIISSQGSTAARQILSGTASTDETWRAQSHTVTEDFPEWHAESF